MMLNTTALAVLAAALIPNASAAATNPGSKLDARQDPRPCPVNGFACGWYLLGGATRICTNLETLENINSTVNAFNSIWQVTDGTPVAWVRECRTGCSNQGDRPETVCNEDL